MTKENPIWIELLYLIAGIALAVAIHANMPKKSYSHPTMYIAPCECMSA
jgi:hypothetical protein